MRAEVSRLKPAAAAPDSFHAQRLQGVTAGQLHECRGAVSPQSPSQTVCVHAGYAA